MELKGNLMQILFDSKDTKKNKATIFGFTVVKIMGTRQCKYSINIVRDNRRKNNS